MINKPPVFLDIPKLRFPITAITSILHRITGVLLFLYLPFALYLLSASLLSSESFYQVKYLIHKPINSFFIWIMLVATTYHVFAGIRHLLMDCGLAESFKQAQITAYVVIALTALSAILLGVWLW